MFVELIESLRCPRAHEASSLVVSADTSEARHVITGTLGCPVCGAEFPIEHGVARFDEPASERRGEAPSDETAMRLAAFLQLTDARGAALLCGRYASHALLVAGLSETPLVLANAAPNVPPDAGAAMILVRDVMPFAAGALRGAAIDEAVPPELARSIVSAVRARGRVVGAATAALPAGVTEIVRDEHMWVAEKSAPPEDPAPRLVSLGRAPR